MQVVNSPHQIEQGIYFFRKLILDKLPDQCWIAGGAIRDYFAQGFITGDIDLFTTDEEIFNVIITFFQKEGTSFIDTNNSIKFRYKKYTFDVVKRHFPSPIKAIDTFDFTICCAAIDKLYLYHHPTFFIDLAKRRLVIHRLPYPLSTLQRLQKYVKKGYWICNRGLLELARAIAEINFDDPMQNHISFYPDGQPKFVCIDYY